MRFVFDTNVTISALLFEHSVPGQAFRFALQKGIVLLSLETLQELSIVMDRPKFDRYVRAAEREEFLAALVERALLINVTKHVNECRDPKDDKFLALAMDGNANSIISGDEDLLVLHPFHDIPILTPATFLSQFEDR